MLTTDWVEENREAITHLPVIAQPEPRHECMVIGCERAVQIRGLCKAHHLRARRAFDPSYTDPRSRRKDNS